MARVLAALLVLTVVAGAITGVAASLDVSSDQLGSGIAPVTSCDTNGVTSSYTVALGLISAVVVKDIADGSSTLGAGACDGETVHVEVLSAGGAVLGSGSATVPADVNTTDATVSVPMTPAPLASAASAVRVTVTG